MVRPFAFGMPKFDLVASLTLCLVMVVVMIESTGMFLALAEITGETVDEARLIRGLRADGLGTVLGGIFNTFPYTSFSQNIGLVGVTGVRSRWVTVIGGFVMLGLGLIPKLAALVEAVPQCVLGGAGPRHVRHGGGHGHAHPRRGGFRRQPQQPLHRRRLGGLRADPPGGARPSSSRCPTCCIRCSNPASCSPPCRRVALNLFFNGLGSQAGARAEATRLAHAAEA